MLFRGGQRELAASARQLSGPSIGVVVTDVIKRIHGKRPGGFNLAELLVVVVILGVMSAIAVAALRPMFAASRTSVQHQDARILQSAEEAYLARRDTNAYATVTELVAERFLRRPSQVNSVCLKPGAGGDYFVVQGIPARQAGGDAACRAVAYRLAKTDPDLYRASTGTPAIP
jgi:prepilin-type N-terminal cleavage/methylation domain-containing protein